MSRRVLAERPRGCHDGVSEFRDAASRIGDITGLATRAGDALVATSDVLQGHMREIGQSADNATGSLRRHCSRFPEAAENGNAQLIAVEERLKDGGLLIAHNIDRLKDGGLEMHGASDIIARAERGVRRSRSRCRPPVAPRVFR